MDEETLRVYLDRVHEANVRFQRTAGGTPEETAALKEYKEAHRMWLLARQTLAETRRDEHGS